MTDLATLDYGRIVEEAMRTVVRRILESVAQEGLSGEQHFYITFNTNHPDVRMPESLYADYPEQMTIVIQHVFRDLETFEDGFSITLDFNKKPARLTIPFDALVTFADPSVNFSLRFHLAVDDLEDSTGEDASSMEPSPSATSDEKVISLHNFRKATSQDT